MPNLKTIAVTIAALTGFILAPSQGCIAGSAQKGAAADPYLSLSHSPDSTGGPPEEGATGLRIELAPHVTDGGKNMFIKTPFLYEEGPAEDPEPLWVRQFSLPGTEKSYA